MIERDSSFEEGARIVGRIYGGPSEQDRPAAPPAIINLDTVQAIHRPRRFAYKSGRWWRAFVIDRVPWQEGIALEYITDRLRVLVGTRLAEAELEEMAGLFQDGVDIFWRLVRKRWWHRRNPFQDVGIGEFFAIASFFSECRTLLPDLALDDSQGSDRRTSARRTTWRTRSRASRRPTATAGWRAVSRAATPTTASGSAGST